MLAGIVLLSITLALLAFLIPAALAKRGSDTVAEAARGNFAGTRKMLHSSHVTPPDKQVYPEDLAEVSTPYTRAAGLRDVRRRARLAAVWRRRGLVAILLMNVALAAATVFGYLPWYAVVIGFGLLFSQLIVSRILTVRLYRRLDAEVALHRANWSEETVVLAEVIGSVEGENEHSVEISVPVQEMMGSLWDPIPVTAPTYVSSPLAPRTVRTIDLAAPVPAQQPVPPVAKEHSKPIDIPKAVGE